MQAKEQKIARQEFLASIGKAVGGSAMLRTMAALGISSSLSACGSSSAASAGNPNIPSPPPPPPGNTAARPGDWPVNIGVGKSVVILGAGIAGMTTALEMTKLGYSCTLLEAQAAAGGRNKTSRRYGIQTTASDRPTVLFLAPTFSMDRQAMTLRARHRRKESTRHWPRPATCTRNSPVKRRAALASHGRKCRFSLVRGATRSQMLCLCLTPISCLPANT